MKRSILFSALLLLLTALGAGGCATTQKDPNTAYRGKPRTFALSVTVSGVLQPTPAQFAAVQAQAVRDFGSLGYVLVTDLSLAEAILRVDFTPNPNDPENSGRATVLGFRNNPYYASAPSYARSPYPSAFGYGLYNSGWGVFDYYGYGYYSYGSSYYDGYSYSSPTLNPITPPASKPHHPPIRHDPAYCPPNTPRPPHTFASFAGTFGSGSSHPQSASRDSSRRHGGDSYSSNSSSSRSSSSWWGSSSSSSDYSNSGSSYSRSESSYQRSEPSYSQSAPSYASSSSYSAPAPSYSSSSDSSSSSSSSSGGGSGNSSGSSSANAHQN